MTRPLLALLTLACFGLLLWTPKPAITAPKKPRKSPTKKRLHRLKNLVRTPPPVIVIRRLPPPVRLLTLAQQKQKLRQGNQAFALAMFRKLREGKGGSNLVFSPLSISSVMTMVSAGARQRTAQQMAKALQHRLSQKILHRNFGRLIGQINPPIFIPLKKLLKKGARKPPPPAYVLTLTNDLWGHKGFAFKRPFLSTLSAHYKATPIRLDFTKAEKARQQINRHIARLTRNKIKQLLPSGSIQASTRLVLTNAIYFKSAWTEQFYKRYTKPHPFWIGAKRSKKVPMMHQINWFSYKQAKGYRVLKLSYARSALSLFLAIPDEKAGLKGLLKGLNATHWEQAHAGLKRTYLKLYLPKFKFQTRFSAKRALQGLGMRDLFSNRADLTGMGGRKGQLKVGDVVHQASIDVHEKGTEAAAATAATVFLTGSIPTPPKPLVLKVDRPFLFWIRHEKTKSTLFLGQVTSP